MENRRFSQAVGVGKRRKKTRRTPSRSFLFPNTGSRMVPTTPKLLPNSRPGRPQLFCLLSRGFGLVQTADRPVHPAGDEGLQAGLSAEVLYLGVVGRHVLPGIDLQHGFYRCAVVW